MPTKAVQEAFDKLRSDVTILVDLQNHVKQKEMELEVLRAQLAQIEATTTTATNDTESTTTTESSTPTTPSVTTTAPVVATDSVTTSGMDVV
jgi:hypothetical protein